MLDSSTVRFEIVEHIGVLNEEPAGWKKELNRVSWDGREPKYDIRSWSADYNYMSRGITLSEAEIRKLVEHLYVRRKTRKPLQERIGETEKQQEQQYYEDQKSMGNTNDR